MSAAAPLQSFPSFMRFWWGRLAGTMAAQMLMVALGWQMYDLTGSAWDLGLVGLAQFLPALPLMLLAGPLIDRHDRRLILAACMVLQVAVAVVLALASWGGWSGRGLILGVSLLLGVARAFQMPSQQALAPMLVPAVVLPRALAFSSGAMQVAVIGGPALGGFVYVAGPAVVYTLCAALFMIGAALVVTIRVRAEPQAREPVSWTMLMAGFVFIWQRKAILGAISLDLFAVLFGGATALLPMFAKDVLHTGPWGLGLLRAAPAVGALLIAIVLTRWPIESGVGRKMFAAVAAYGVAMGVFALSSSFVLSFAALLASGVADMVSVIVRQSMVQLDTPNPMRGRVAAVNSVFIGASNQLGEFESGATAAVLGPVGSVLLGSVGTLLVVALWMRWFPDLLRRERLTAPEPGGFHPMPPSTGKNMPPAGAGGKGS
jgi:MFS family permease